MLVKHATVKIPQPLADKIVEIAVQKLGTYRTVSEFVIESSRQHLEAIKPSV
jgi:Arc/MetJ-type ribon-helix-helix transcriptional regulator